jgi:hypothetical protein
MRIVKIRLFFIVRAYHIEHKNDELKNAHRMTRAKYRGQFGMRIQAFLTAFVVNVKRMIKLKEALLE